MYKNPLNNGDISDYNSLKNQRDYGKIIRKYSSKKLQTEPNELQKYYQYLTYQQPILDELNYVAERLRTEDIETQKKNFNFIEDQKIEREKRMKQLAGINKENIKDELFDNSSLKKLEDITPTINTDLELEDITPTINTDLELEYTKPDILELKNDLFTDIFSNIFSDNFSINETEDIPMAEVINVKKKKKEKTPEELQLIEENKAKSKAKKEAKKKKEKRTLNL
jgi:hypothetical protein